jgi:uncharacterized protein YqjF (DUF2071 family)
MAPPPVVPGPAAQPLNPSALLAARDHRPWPLPTEPWALAMSWQDLLFAHWPIDPAAPRARLPAGLTLDTFDGQAWLGIVPFRMSGVRPRGQPALPWLGAFAELNVRTYVRLGEKPGVFFFSLDAANPLAVAVARTWYHLPYFRARMACRARGEAIDYVSRRTHGGAPPAEFRASYRPVAPARPAAPGSLEHWLAERYCLYAVDPRGALYRGEVHHRPWPLQAAEASFAVDTLAASHRLTPRPVSPLLHFSRRLDVLAWSPRRVAP